ncbi:hypothetical protein PENSPDRAFT_688594 [Peniophora sp. CONT]|nr:hypothetical protein PENSPDRAFT_688594 [Peniophora sp. CONT]
MAPSMRSTAPGGLNSRNRVSDHAIDESSSEDIEEKAPKRKPRKRARSEQTAKAVAKKPAASGRTKKSGRLDILPRMPLDILGEIFSFLDPGDLIHIARTTKSFRRLLLASNQFSYLWRASWARMEGYPTCPEGFPLLTWINLLFGGPYCQTCAAPGAKRIYFSIRAKLCKNCLSKSMLSIERVTWVETIESHELYKYIPVVFEGKDMYVYEKDLVDLQMAVASATADVEPGSARQMALAAVILSRKKTFAPRIAHLYECQDWLARLEKNRKGDVEERRSKRRENILQRLRDLGYTYSDASSVWKKPNVTSVRPLTDREWNDLLPKLLPSLDDNRKWRLQNERKYRRDLRVSAIHEASLALLGSDAVKPQDVPYLPRPRACTQFGSFSALLDEDEVEISADWKQRVDVALRDALTLMRGTLTKHQIEFATLIQGFEVDGPEALRILSSPTSVFVVQEYGWSRVCFGLEAVVCADYRPSYDLPVENYSESRLPRVRKIAPESALIAVRSILRMLQLEDTTTILELDILDPCFTCKTCPTKHDPHFFCQDGLMRDLHYRQAMNWRETVFHVYDAHGDSADDVQLHTLTTSERAAVGAEGTAVAYRRQRNQMDLKVKVFACCHCKEHSLHTGYFIRSGVLSYMTLDDARLHAKRRHDIEDATEGVDFYQDPLGYRGVLGGFRKEYCLVEE